MGVRGIKRERILPHLKECGFRHKENSHQVLSSFIEIDTKNPLKLF
ncbi:hypothetical protein HPHPH1_0234 [Helicobacter pylori Hp H-1]|uniref:Uncharacterized protein n=1 Tax=Helicobacter pylori Hp H-1 TaxID=992058 RepID=M7SNT9_HELPX|nr:hypothetical protein HPHPH1_0234 [Helicobacter pylori Hp H-1]